VQVHHRLAVGITALAVSVGACTGDGGDGERAGTRAASTRPAAVTTVPAPTRPAAPAPVGITLAPGRVPRYEDATAAAGLELEPLPVRRPCFLRALEDRRRAADRRIARLPRLGDALCQVERFTGGVAVGDADGDGHPDLYVTRLDGPGRLFRNRGDGTFAEHTAAAGLDVLGAPSSGAAFVDVDNDGDPDLVVTTILGPGPFLFVNDGTGRFRDQARRRGLRPRSGRIEVRFSVAVGDFDRDGWPDLFLTGYPASLEGDVGPSVSPSVLYRNRGARLPGHFADVTRRAGLHFGHDTFAFGATFRDYDRDGHADLWVTADFGTSRLFWNRGDGTFTDGTDAAGVGTDENGMGSTTGDVDGDGIDDVFVSSIFDARGSSLTRGGNWGGTGNRLYRGLGDRRFADATDAAGVRDGGWGWGAAFVDTTNRGGLDLVQTSGLDILITQLAEPYLGGPTFVWVPDGTGRMVDRAAEAGIGAVHGRGLAVLDADGDGRLDLVVARAGGALTYYRNVTPEAGSWLGVRVEGTRSASDGWGAVVEVTVREGERPRRFEVQSVTDYLGQSDRTVHVGLGPGVDRVARLRVRFPAGGREVVQTGVTTGQVVSVTEPGR
jgi:hypothetical protein